MKKQFLLLTVLFPLLASCGSSYNYTPRVPYPGGEEEEESTNSNSEEEEESNQTINFYIDYSHSDTPLFTKSWNQLKPLGSCPEEAKLSDTDAKDPLYPHFLGYSMYPTCLDTSLLWDFETDFYQVNILNLYGIWVA